MFFFSNFKSFVKAGIKVKCCWKCWLRGLFEGIIYFGLRFVATSQRNMPYVHSATEFTLISTAASASTATTYYFLYVHKIINAFSKFTAYFRWLVVS